MITNSVYSVLGKYRMFRCPYCGEIHTYDIEECSANKINKTLYLKVEARCCDQVIIAKKDSEGKAREDVDCEFSV